MNSVIIKKKLKVPVEMQLTPMASVFCEAKGSRSQNRGDRREKESLQREERREVWESERRGRRTPERRRTETVRRLGRASGQCSRMWPSGWTSLFGLSLTRASCHSATFCLVSPEIASRTQFLSLLQPCAGALWACELRDSGLPDAVARDDGNDGPIRAWGWG